MKSKYTPVEQAAYYRSRCANQAQEIERLKSEMGYEHIRKQCEQEAQKKNMELAAELRQKSAEANRLRKDLDMANAKAGRIERTIQELRNQLAELNAKLSAMSDTHRQDVAIIKALNKQIERLSKESDKSGEDYQVEIQKAREKIAKLEEDQREAQKTIDCLNRQVETLGGEAQKLQHQLNLDSTTSSLPTSASHFKPPIQNSREQSDNQQGGQPGHPHHPRKLNGIPGKAEFIFCSEDDPLWNDPEYSFERFEIKHVVKPVVVVIDQYVLVPVFRNLKTGAHKNAACPNWAFDEFNYAPEAKAMMLYLSLVNRDAVRKCGDVMRDFSKGILNPSTGFISGLSIEFAKKSEPERAQAFQELVDSKVMNVDGTTISVGGIYYNVTICVAGPITGYFFKPYKGEKGVKGTPIEETAAILVSDHDVVYYKYGVGHQECLQHVERYLKDSIAVEPEYTWNVKMLEFVQKMIHEAKKVDQRSASEATTDSENPGMDFESTDGPHPRFSQKMIEDYRKQFNQILQDGLDEYNATPNRKWYPKGSNLCKRMAEDPDSYLLFMSDDRVPYTNNAAEREAREIKRKQAAAMTFRGFLGVIAYCESMSVIRVINRQGIPILETMAQIFAREVTVGDSRRLGSVCEGVLLEVIQKDEDKIQELTEKTIPEVTQNHLKAKQISAAAFAEYDKVRQERIAESGETSEPTDQEKKLLVRLNQVEREVYNLERDISVLNIKLEKRRKHLKDAKKQQKAIKNSPCMQEHASTKASEEAARNTREEGPAKTVTLDTEALSKVAAEESAVRARLNNAMNRVDEMTVILNGILYPPMDFKPGSRKSVFLGKEGIDRSALPEAVKAQKALDQAKKEVEDITRELSEVTKKLDALRKGRRPGRRARARNQRQPKEALGKTG